MVAAANLHEVAQEQGEAVAAKLDAAEVADLEAVYGSSARDGRARGYSGALATLKKDQSKRKTRVVRDSIDGALVDLLSVYRDILVVQTGAQTALINDEARPDIASLARRSTPEATVRRMEAVLGCREAITANAAPLLALEAMMLDLGR